MAATLIEHAREMASLRKDYAKEGKKRTKLRARAKEDATKLASLRKTNEELRSMVDRHKKDLLELRTKAGAIIRTQRDQNAELQATCLQQSFLLDYHRKVRK